MNSVIKDLIEYVGISNEIPADYTVTTFKEFLLQEHINLSECYPDIEQITRVSACVNINDFYIVNSPMSLKDDKGSVLNPGGQTVTGKTLVINGLIKQNIYYVADTNEQNVMVIENDCPFGTYVILPETASESKSKYKVNAYIEDIMVEVLTPRDILKCVSLFLEVK